MIKTITKTTMTMIKMTMIIITVIMITTRVIVKFNLNMFVFKPSDISSRGKKAYQDIPNPCFRPFDQEDSDEEDLKRGKGQKFCRPFTDTSPYTCTHTRPYPHIHATCTSVPAYKSSETFVIRNPVICNYINEGSKFYCPFAFKDCQGRMHIF